RGSSAVSTHCGVNGSQFDAPPPAPPAPTWADPPCPPPPFDVEAEVEVELEPPAPVPALPEGAPLVAVPCSSAAFVSLLHAPSSAVAAPATARPSTRRRGSWASSAGGVRFEDRSSSFIVAPL